MLKKLIALLFISTSAPAMAHLTWIEPGQQSMGLSTGHNFPAKEITVKGQYVDAVRCVDAQGEIFNLAFDENSIRYVYKERPTNCLATLKTSLIELSPRQGAQHFEENKVDKALVNKVLGSEKFNEEYFKTAQIQPIKIDSALYNPAIAQFVSLPGDSDNIYVYKNGQAVPDLPVGLEYPETPITLWSKTDATGKVTLLLQPRGEALLRALTTEENGTAYKSQFLSVILNAE
ncbi:hypothetical protein [Limnobacter parvus]|uniref:DUF4198 domain-containing protein n=1 Tax=Limnobacter parvus TaxID=2939690 RepID=A0ABT1XLA3_9BURK|nr:hypothetical protein [Limnobacter parvus]MCR2747646.1 hypothetical protein [Limnobacter parvus]